MGRVFSSKHTCPDCGSDHVVSNGGYSPLNWLLAFMVHLFPTLSINPRVRVNRLYCQDCKNPVDSQAQKTNTRIREAMKLLRGRLICLLRYSGGLSIRKISFIVEEAFGIRCSVGYVTTLCQKVNKKAHEKMEIINECAKKKALMVLFDETFPKIKSFGATRLGVAIDEYGLIRGVKAIVDRKKDLYKFLKSTLTKIKPLYFLSDYDKTYPKIVKNIDPAIILCKDFVHALGTIYRNARTAINRITVSTQGKITKGRKKEISQLKKDLISKKLYPVLHKIRKGFWKEYSQVGGLYIEGGLADLEELAEDLPSMQGFHKKTDKFINKYLEVWNMQMELYYQKGLPTTTNSIESKNSLFKIFRNNSKCFDNKTSMEEFFSAVALMENFSVKTRGKNKGTCAITRAGVDLEELGGKDFFELVGLEEIILGKKSKNTTKCTLKDTIKSLKKVA